MAPAPSRTVEALRLTVASVMVSLTFAVALAVTDSEVLEVAPAPDPVDTSALGVRKDGTSVYRPPNAAKR